MLELLKNHTFEFIITGLFSLIAWILRQWLATYKKSIATKQQRTKQESEEQLLIKQGVLALLRFRVNRMCFTIRTKGFMTLDEKFDLTDLYTAYHALGGNSRTHMIYEETLSKYDTKEEEQ